jgi:hypothetical protein
VHATGVVTEAGRREEGSGKKGRRERRESALLAKF